MKVVVDLVGVTQHWNPDTNMHTNTADLRFGPTVLRVAVNEQQLQDIIAHAVGTETDEGLLIPAYGEAPAEPAEDYGLYEEGPGPELATNDEGSFGELPTNSEGERVFGGDVGQQNHTLFESLDTEALPESETEPVERPISSTQQRLNSIQATFAERPITKRKNKKAELRARARSVPAGRIPQDEMGYPDHTRIVPKKRAPIAAPEVVQKEVHTSVEKSDDLFDQG